MSRRVCAVSFKECWQDERGDWYSSGGFPLQMAAVASLFDSMTLMITRSDRPGAGGLRLPPHAEVVVLRRPIGADWRRKLSILRNAPYYISTIDRFVRQADYVHVPLPGDIPLLAALVALVRKKPLIARYCGSWASTDSTTLMNRFTRLLMRRFAGGRNVMLATGEASAPPAPGMNWIFATSLSSRELREIEPVTSRALSDPPRLVYAGRLSAEKGVAQLLEALSLLRREGFSPLPRLTLVGDGPERDRLSRRVQELGLAERVEFAGQLDRRALSAALSSADVCVQPSLTEGYSKAWLDAFAHGLPVLASDAGAAGVVIGADRGWLVPPGDVPRLAAALRSVLTDRVDWPALRRRCRAFAEGRTLEEWAREIGSLCARQWAGTLREGRLVA